MRTSATLPGRIDWNLTPRGDPRWNRYSNKRDCPDGAVPLWQVLNPLVLGLRNYERALIAEEVAAHPVLGRDVYHTSSGMLYVSFGRRRPTRRRIVRLRREIYRVLDDGVVGALPEDIRKKYG